MLLFTCLEFSGGEHIPSMVQLSRVKPDLALSCCSIRWAEWWWASLPAKTFTNSSERDLTFTHCLPTSYNECLVQGAT